MFFQQYYLQCLSHASYLIGDTTTGRAVVVDPQRDVSQYLADAAANGLTIEAVLETHFHADFLSGHLELAEATGATIWFGAAAAGRAEFPIETFSDGQVLSLGDVTIQALATPGHTPESTSFVVYERASDMAEGKAPYGVLTGDTLFIGDVGRPDLLASFGVTADELARMLYHSLHDKLMKLPDTTKVYPAHGAGSACGKNLSTETVSTIGEQRRTNYALAPMSEEAFVQAVTEGQAAAPMYFAFAATKNRLARERLDEEAEVTPMTLEQVLEAQRSGAAVVDTRSDQDFEIGHLVGAMNVGLSGRFAEYTGEVVQPNTPIVLVAEPGGEVEARVRLARIGFDTVVGYLADPVKVFMEHPTVVEQSSRLTVDEFEARRRELPNLQIVDVRGPGETALGVIPGARLVQLPTLVKRLDELSKDAPTVVYCAGGYRSSIASSTLRANGFSDVSDIRGGFTAYDAAGYDRAVPVN
jgi:glyoxylase-like metal-dependent hydrolase (beta-lactamase superfamily II)/rhodanese-related sulfurtransferase